VISGLSLVVTLYGIVIQVMGMEFSKKCIFPVVFLVFMIPVPHIDLIATGLAAFSGQVAASMADVLMIPAISNGAEIYLPDASLVVGVPCSGMSTIIGLYIPTSLLIYLLDCPLLKKIIFWCMILPVAILSNIVRIFLLIVAFNWGGMNLALDFFHTLYGYLLPLIAFLFLVFIIMACRCFNLRSDIL
jgi:exosortase